MLQKFIEEIKQLAIASPDAERCGVIVDDKVIEFSNAHDEPSMNFMLEARDVVGLHSSDFEVWHTHTPYGFAQLTPADVRTAKFIKRPVVMVRGDGEWDRYDPNHRFPYIGRTWRTYHRNCYTLAQDWYRHEMGVILPDFYLNSPNEFLSDSPSIFLKQAKGVGFQQIEEPGQVGDIILTTEGKGKGWHCSIVVEVSHSRGLICLSQWVDRCSGYFSYRALKNRVHSVWRLG